jgi:hypothetical protein
MTVFQIDTAWVVIANYLSIKIGLLYYFFSGLKFPKYISEKFYHIHCNALIQFMDFLDRHECASDNYCMLFAIDTQNNYPLLPYFSYTGR